MSGVAGIGSTSGEKESRRNILWNNFGSHHAFTTGRHQRQSDANFGNKVRPKGPSQTLKVSFFEIIPGVKLNSSEKTNCCLYFSSTATRQIESEKFCHRQRCIGSDECKQ